MKNIVYLCLIGILTLSSFSVNAQISERFPKMDVSPMDAATYPSNWRDANKLVKVIYSRPQLKGRAFEKLAPTAKVWRTGANEAPEITFYSDVVFGGKVVAAGTYSLFTIPNTDKWTVILSNQKNIWGSYFYDAKQDAIRVDGAVSKSDKNIEAFSIAFDDEDDEINMYLGWADRIITVPVKKK